MKAVVAGAAGGIGQPLSLLLKTSKYIDELALYDIPNAPVKGVGVDLSHISSPCLKVEGFTPENDGQKLAFTGADIVVIPAGIPRMPGMTRDDLFNKNASIVKGLIEGIAQYCPKAFILIISNPVNSTVPIAAEVLKKAGVFDPKRLFGVTTLDIVRAETFIQSFTGEKDPSKTVVPVVGGHSGATIVPLFSLAKPSFKIPQGKEYDDLINRVQFGGDEVVKAKTVGEKSFGSATLSMAFAGYRFAESVMAAAKGEKGIVECTYTYLPGLPGGEAIAKEVGNDFFSLPVTLGPNGAESVDNILAKADSQEQKLLEAAKKDLSGNISKGVNFVLNPPKL